MKIKSVSVDPGLLNQVVTDHARKLGLVLPSEELSFEHIEIDQPRLGLIFKKEVK